MVRRTAAAIIQVSRYNGSAAAYSVAVGPAGRRVYVTGVPGDGAAATSSRDYATIAYKAATGARLWVSRYNGPARRDDVASSVTAGPHGGKVFVTGVSKLTRLRWDYATVACNVATGARHWARRYGGFACSVAASPNRRRVYVTGYSAGNDYATIAYNAATGAQLWVRRYNGPGNGDDTVYSVAIGPGGRRVFVTG